MSALKGHPKGLYLIFATSTAERFSYYGMRAIFILFLTQALLFDKEAAASIYGSYTGLVYLTPLIGGYIADKYWGIRRSVFWGAVMMAVGQFLMFMSASTLDNTNLAHWMMYGGLGFLILGNGCFKPTVSSLVGQLYEPGDRRLDAAYTIFYMGVNVGSFAAPLICGYLGDTGDPHDFKWGFLAAGIMTLFTPYTESERMSYIREYLSTSETKYQFAKRTGICRRLLILWLDKYHINDKVMSTDHPSFNKYSAESLNELEKELAALRAENRKLQRALQEESLRHEACEELINLAESTYHIKVRKNSDAK